MVLCMRLRRGCGSGREIDLEYDTGFVLSLSAEVL